MKEAEYINATNLAKIRIARAVIRDMVFLSQAYELRQSNLLKDICELEDEINMMIKIKD